MKSRSTLSLSLFVIMTITTFSCLGQTSDEGSSFGAFFAMPVGNFKSTGEDGGFARPGWGLVFDSRYNAKFLPKNMSIYFHSTYQWNKMDNNKIAERFTQALGNRTTATESRYSPLLTTIGPSYGISLGSSTRLIFNTGVGIMFNNTRAFSIVVYDDTNTEILRETINFDNDPAFAFLVGLELKFKLLQDIMGGAFYIDYTSAKQDTKLTFTSLDPINSFEKLQYLNMGFKFTFPKN